MNKRTAWKNLICLASFTGMLSACASEKTAPSNEPPNNLPNNQVHTLQVCHTDPSSGAANVAAGRRTRITLTLNKKIFRDSVQPQNFEIFNRDNRIPLKVSPAIKLVTFDASDTEHPNCPKNVALSQIILKPSELPISRVITVKWRQGDDITSAKPEEHVLGVIADDGGRLVGSSLEFKTTNEVENRGLDRLKPISLQPGRLITAEEAETFQASLGDVFTKYFTRNPKQPIEWDFNEPIRFSHEGPAQNQSKEDFLKSIQLDLKTPIPVQEFAAMRIMIFDSIKDFGEIFNVLVKHQLNLGQAMNELREKQIIFTEVPGKITTTNNRMKLVFTPDTNWDDDFLKIVIVAVGGLIGQRSSKPISDRANLALGGFVHMSEARFPLIQGFDSNSGASK